jgi:hypothetical protein
MMLGYKLNNEGCKTPTVQTQGSETGHLFGERASRGPPTEVGLMGALDGQGYSVGSIL